MEFAECTNFMITSPEWPKVKSCSNSVDVAVLAL